MERHIVWRGCLCVIVLRPSLAYFPFSVARERYDVYGPPVKSYLPYPYIHLALWACSVHPQGCKYLYYERMDELQAIPAVRYGVESDSRWRRSSVSTMKSVVSNRPMQQCSGSMRIRPVTRKNVGRERGSSNIGRYELQSNNKVFWEQV
jgi:hypothetical protein